MLTDSRVKYVGQAEFRTDHFGFVKYEKNVLVKLQLETSNLPANDPLNRQRAMAAVAKGLIEAGFNVEGDIAEQTVRGDALMMRNIGTGFYTPIEAFTKGKQLRPINAAFDYLWSRLKKGDTVWLRNASMMYGRKLMPDRRLLDWVGGAISKGVTVNVVWIDEKELGKQKERLCYLYNKMANYKYPGWFLSNKYKNLDQERKDELQKLLVIRKIQKTNHRGIPIKRDHAKVYAFEFQDHRVFTIGTWNLNLQSYYGSNENQLLLDDQTGQLTQTWLTDAWEKGITILPNGKPETLAERKQIPQKFEGGEIVVVKNSRGWHHAFVKKTHSDKTFDVEFTDVEGREWMAGASLEEMRKSSRNSQQMYLRSCHAGREWMKTFKDDASNGPLTLVK